MKRGIVRVAAAASIVAAGAACEGYTVSFGTTVDQQPGGAFYTVWEVPATSLRPWSERGTIPVGAPPDGGASGATTLPAGPGSSATMPPEAPAK